MINLLWLLITNNLLLADETSETPDSVQEDLSAKKDFTSFYVQLSDTDQTLATRKLSTVDNLLTAPEYSAKSAQVPGAQREADALLLQARRVPAGQVVL